MYQVTIRSCGRAIGTDHSIESKKELLAFMNGVEAAIAMIDAEVVIFLNDEIIERKIIGSEKAKREAGAWIKHNLDLLGVA